MQFHLLYLFQWRSIKKGKCCVSIYRAAAPKKEQKMSKISILGAGNVGAAIAYALIVGKTATRIVMIDINKEKAEGEAMDMQQGIPFFGSAHVTTGSYEDIAGSDIVVVALGLGRKPGQSRLDLAQINVNIAKQTIPQAYKYAPNAVFIIVTNPVDVVTYTAIKSCGIPEKQVIGTGTMLDSGRLRAILGDRLHLSYSNIHAYVYGEHGDSSVIAWSQSHAMGMNIEQYYNCISDIGFDLPAEKAHIEDYVRSSGAEIIARKGNTQYAIALSVREVCESIFNNLNICIPVSSMIRNRYGIDDVCLSLPFVVGKNGIRREINPPLTPEEEEKLRKSAAVLRNTIDSLDI